MRRAVTPAIPPSMYRHFAILTVVLTACLAMFAEGENREARAAPAAHAAKPAAPVALVSATSTTAATQAADWSDVETFSDSGFGGSMEGLLGGGDSSTIPDLEESLVPGYSPGHLASLSEQERDLLLGGLQESGMHEPDIHSRRGAALAATSSRRSGSASVDD
jgi:hypothetical protein